VIFISLVIIGMPYALPLFLQRLEPKIYLLYIILDFGSLIFPSFLEVVYHADMLFYSLLFLVFAKYTN